MAKERVLHSERRPYLVADSLDELVGPTVGLVELPLRLDWSEQGTYNLDEPPATASAGPVGTAFPRVGRRLLSADGSAP